MSDQEEYKGVSIAGWYCYSCGQTGAGDYKDHDCPNTVSITLDGDILAASARQRDIAAAEQAVIEAARKLSRKNTFIALDEAIEALDALLGGDA